MPFFTRQDFGRVYVLKMILPDDTVIHKIGMTNSNRSTDRMLEILRSWFNHYRFVPYTELRLDMECEFPLKLEQFTHNVLYKNQFIPNHPVEGHTEMFTGVNELRLIHFLKNFNDRNLVPAPELHTDEYRALGELLTND